MNAGLIEWPCVGSPRERWRIIAEAAASACGPAVPGRKARVSHKKGYAGERQRWASAGPLPQAGTSSQLTSNGSEQRKMPIS